MSAILSYTKSRISTKQLDNEDVNELFFISVTTGNVELLQQCLKKGVDVNKLNMDGFGALHYAAMSCLYDITRILLTSPDIDINMYSLEYHTPLHLACLFGPNMYYVKFLLSRGADPNACDRFSKRVIHFAVLRESTDMVQWLINYQADINVKDEFGSTPLSMALLDKNNSSIIALLLKNGANPNTINESSTPLLLDCILVCQNEKMFRNIKLLIKYHADPFVIHPLTLRNGLHYVSITGYEPLADFLLSKGVDLLATDYCNKTPTDIARHHKNYNILAAYVQHLPRTVLEKLFRKIEFEHMKAALNERKITMSLFNPPRTSRERSLSSQDEYEIS